MQHSLFSFVEQPVLSIPDGVVAAVEELAANGGAQARGAVFTRREVVGFILDLVGYTDDKPLFTRRILEPSCGRGDFLLPIIDRCIGSIDKSGIDLQDHIESFASSIVAVELHKDTYTSTMESVASLLMQRGIGHTCATRLAASWVRQGDFLLAPLEDPFDYIVGNPPYVRQENIPAALLAEYRRRFKTMYDRADIYVAFYEKSLGHLRKHGTLGFICADRWMKNRYGGPLRELIAKSFHLKAYIDMTDTDAFHTEVSSYPAITVIRRDKPGPTRIALRPAIDSDLFTALSTKLADHAHVLEDDSVREIPAVAKGSAPWVLEHALQTLFVRRLEQQYPSLEQAGCKVGIGVATGADKVFIGAYDSLTVEPSRKLPLATTRDIQSGEIAWKGLGVINPFAESGKLVDLKEYPLLLQYLEHHEPVLRKRHCAQRNPKNWYRTIDRIWPRLTNQPKLLIPDIKGEAHVVYEPGNLYPHHNLYYVVSQAWDLRALQAVLLSNVSKLVVATYSTRMRGGYLRFQAQYLRRIHIPFWQDVPRILREELTQAAVARDLDACNSAVERLYSMTREEVANLSAMGADNGP